MRYFLILLTIFFISCKTEIEQPIVDTESYYLAKKVMPVFIPSYLPRNSDVIIRSLNFRPVNTSDTYDTFQAMNDFHVTRLEWCYISNLTDAQALVKTAAVKSSGRFFGASVNTNVTSVNASVNLNGEPVYSKHQRTWTTPPMIGCMSNPAYYQLHLNDMIRTCNVGAASIQRDDPGQAESIMSIGGCFCNYCMDNFRLWLRRNASADSLKIFGVSDITTFNYKTHLQSLGNVPVGDAFSSWKGGRLKELFAKYQSQTNYDFFIHLRSDLTKAQGKEIPMSGNNTSYQDWSKPFYKIFDWGMSEMMVSTGTAKNIYERSRAALQLSKKQVFSTPKFLTPNELTDSARLKLNRKVIAQAYACGAVPVVPWDLYDQLTTGNERFFGKKEDYADLFGFVRAVAPYLDNYVEVAAYGKDLTVSATQPKIILNDLPENVYAIVRVVPQSTENDIVIHIVDWRDEKTAFNIDIDKRKLFAGNKVSFKMLTSKPFDQDINTQVEVAAKQMLTTNELFSAKQSSAYLPFIDERQLDVVESGNTITLSVSTVSPWGIIIVSNLH